MEKEEGKQQNQQNNVFIGMNGEVTGLGFATRDQGIKSKEDQGQLEFIIIKNDKTHETMQRLIDLKNIFARQLPKMPKEYIVKLVFDRNHESLVILKDKKKIIGGICYRMYPTQRFAEVAFLAVTATEQVKGYGTRLMNIFKNKMQNLGIEYLLTYADNYAIGYFKKQGFSKEHRMDPERWKGFIKDYDGGTFMECYIHPKMDYINISEILKEQKKFVQEQIKKLCINDEKFEGIKSFATAKKAAEKRENQTETVIQIEDIPGIKQSGWTYEDYVELKNQKERSFYIQCQNIIDLMRKHKSSWPFQEPVNKDDVPDYYDVITDPIDLKAIEKKLQSGFYSNKELFINDINKIFENTKTYNQPETIYYKAANELSSYITPYLLTLKDDKLYDSESEQKSKKKPMGIKKKIKKDKSKI